MALKDLDLGAWIDRPGDVDCKDKKWNAPSTWYIGRPPRTWSGVLGKLMLLRNCWGFDPCAATSPETQDYNRFVIWFIPIAWYFFWFLLHRGLVWHIWCFREELVKAARRAQPLHQTFWPSALCVESISPSAPVPPAFICPITMAPMANPAITPRGTSYDREVLSDWISIHHRYPGGEVRAVRKHTHSQRPPDAAHSPATQTGPRNTCARPDRAQLRAAPAHGGVDYSSRGLSQPVAQTRTSFATSCSNDRA